MKILTGMELYRLYMRGSEPHAFDKEFGAIVAFLQGEERQDAMRRLCRRARQAHDVAQIIITSGGRLRQNLYALYEGLVHATQVSGGLPNAFRFFEALITAPRSKRQQEVCAQALRSLIACDNKHELCEALEVWPEATPGKASWVTDVLPVLLTADDRWCQALFHAVLNWQKGAFKAVKHLAQFLDPLRSEIVEGLLQYCASSELWLILRLRGHLDLTHFTPARILMQVDLSTRLGDDMQFEQSCSVAEELGNDLEAKFGNAPGLAAELRRAFNSWLDSDQRRNWGDFRTRERAQLFSQLTLSDAQLRRLRWHCLRVGLLQTAYWVSRQIKDSDPAAFETAVHQAFESGNLSVAWRNITSKHSPTFGDVQLIPPSLRRCMLVDALEQFDAGKLELPTREHLEQLLLRSNCVY